MRIAVTSDTMSVEDITILVEDEVVDRLSAVAGSGGRPGLRRPRKDLPHRCRPGQARQPRHYRWPTLRRRWALPPSMPRQASLTSASQDLVVRANATIDTPRRIRGHAGQGSIRIGDIATVSLGPDGNAVLRANGQAGVGLGIVRQADSNTSTSRTACEAPLPSCAASCCRKSDIKITSDEATFVNGSIKEVIIALLLAAGIVIAVIYLFLLEFEGDTDTGAHAAGGTGRHGWPPSRSRAFQSTSSRFWRWCWRQASCVDDAIVVLENIVTAGQSRHGAARRGRGRHARSLLCGHHDDGDARGSLHADIVPARQGRRALHRVRFRAGHLGAAFIHRCAVAVPHVGLALAQAAKA